jgi:hypothetical protein
MPPQGQSDTGGLRAFPFAAKQAVNVGGQHEPGHRHRPAGHFAQWPHAGGPDHPISLLQSTGSETLEQSFGASAHDLEPEAEGDDATARGCPRYLGEVGARGTGYLEEPSVAPISMPSSAQ